MAIKKKNVVLFRKIFYVTNTLCLLSAFAFTVLGFIYLFELSDMDTSVNDQDLTTLQYIAIVFGFCLIFDVLFGYILVYKAIVNMLKVYCVTVPTINLVIVIAFIVLNIQTNIMEAFDTIWRTRIAPENQVAMNHIQTRFLCCGLNGSTSYPDVFNLPQSCCPTSLQIATCTYTFAHKNGCFQYVEYFAREVWGAFGATIIGLELSGTISFVLAIILMREFRRPETIILCVNRIPEDGKSNYRRCATFLVTNIGTLKFLFHISNLLCAFGCIQLIVFGVSNLLDTEELGAISTGDFISSPHIVSIILGAFLLINSCYGFSSAARQLPVSMNCYTIMQLNIFVFCIITLWISDIKESMANAFQYVWDNRNTITEYEAVLKSIQFKLGCCGMNGPIDYIEIDPAKIYSQNCVVNTSCRSAVDDWASSIYIRFLSSLAPAAILTCLSFLLSFYFTSAMVLKPFIERERNIVYEL